MAALDTPTPITLGCMDLVGLPTGKADGLEGWPVTQAVNPKAAHMSPMPVQY